MIPGIGRGIVGLVVEVFFFFLFFLLLEILVVYCIVKSDVVVFPLFLFIDSGFLSDYEFPSKLNCTYLYVQSWNST